MKKITMLSVLSLSVLLLAGCGRKQANQTQPTTPAPVAQQPTQPVANQKKVVFKTDTFGFQLTMPKEWSEYAVYYDFSGCSGGCTTIDFLLPTKDKNYVGYNMELNGKKYVSMMKINAWAPPSFDERVKSTECKNAPCPDAATVIKRSNDYVFTMDGPQDAPEDFGSLPYQVGLDYPTNFQKYFKFDLISQ